MAPGSDSGRSYQASPQVSSSFTSGASEETDAGDPVSWYRDRFTVIGDLSSDKAYVCSFLPKVFAPYVSVNGLMADEINDYEVDDDVVIFHPGVLALNDIIDVRYAYIGEPLADVSGELRADDCWKHHTLEWYDSANLIVSATGPSVPDLTGAFRITVFADNVSVDPFHGLTPWDLISCSWYLNDYLGHQIDVGSIIATDTNQQYTYATQINLTPERIGIYDLKIVGRAGQEITIPWPTE
jgi:hypothetical protein